MRSRQLSNPNLYAIQFPISYSTGPFLWQGKSNSTQVDVGLITLWHRRQELEEYSETVWEHGFYFWDFAEKAIVNLQRSYYRLGERNCFVKLETDCLIAGRLLHGDTTTAHNLAALTRRCKVMQQNSQETS